MSQGRYVWIAGKKSISESGAAEGMGQTHQQAWWAALFPFAALPTT